MSSACCPWRRRFEIAHWWPCCSNRLAIPQVRRFVRSSAKGDEDRIVQERGRHQNVQDRDLGRYTRQPKRRFPTEAVLSCLHSKPNCHSASQIILSLQCFDGDGARDSLSLAQSSSLWRQRTASGLFPRPKAEAALRRATRVCCAMRS